MIILKALMQLFLFSALRAPSANQAFIKCSTKITFMIKSWMIPQILGCYSILTLSASRGVKGWETIL